MNRVNKNLISFQIQNEYKVMDDAWLKRHYRTLVGLIILSFIVELIVTAALFKSGAIQIPLTKYIYKYILVPASVNLILIMLAFFVMYSKRMNQKMKVYSISLLSVFACFVAYTVHGIFESLYVIFFVPILFTVIYSDFMLTTMTAFASISSRLVSDLFIVWDPDKASPFDDNMRFVDFIISIIA
ncbi:MAG: GGDEF domain-containing protein, partial [Candidatus Moranbacteria bacterium]|nr:GGDEF domain-containing protein [Candidatus Moranbacteria bacterium]